MDIRKLSIDDAIKHANEKAKELREEGRSSPDPTHASVCHECARDHEQLAVWLEEVQARGDLLQYIEDKDPEIATKSEIAAIILQSPEMTEIAGKITRVFNTTVDLVREVMEAAGNAMAHLVESQIEREEEE